MLNYLKIPFGSCLDKIAWNQNRFNVILIRPAMFESPSIGILWDIPAVAGRESWALAGFCGLPLKADWRLCCTSGVSMAAIRREPVASSTRYSSLHSKNRYRSSLPSCSGHRPHPLQAWSAQFLCKVGWFDIFEKKSRKIKSLKNIPAKLVGVSAYCRADLEHYRQSCRPGCCESRVILLNSVRSCCPTQGMFKLHPTVKTR